MSAEDSFTVKQGGEEEEALPARGLVKPAAHSAVNETYR